MSKNLKQKGFSAVEAIIILLVVALLALGVWFIWDKNKSDKAEKSAARSNSSQNEAEEQASDAEQADAQQYLVIKEWGVRFKTEAANADAYYNIESGKPNYAYLSLNEFKDTECAADDITLGVYVRFTKDEVDEQSGDTYLKLYPNAPKVGDYYYYFSDAQAYCSENAIVKDKAKAAADAFRNNANSVEAAGN